MTLGSRALTLSIGAEVERQSLASGQAVVCAEFRATEGGQFRVKARTADDHDRLTQTLMTIWVVGAQHQPSTLESGRAGMIPESSRVNAGEFAKVFVSAPFQTGHGLMTLRRGQIVREEVFQIQDGVATLEVLAEPDLLPGFAVGVDLVGRGEDGAPVFATGKLNFEMTADHREVSVELELAESEVVPQGETALTVKVHAPNGQEATGAEVVVWVVDEAILALSNYQTPSPLETFYVAPLDHVKVLDSRTTLVVDRPNEAEAPDLARNRGGPMIAQGAPPPAPGAFGAALGGAMSSSFSQAAPEGGGATPIAVRSDFNPLACFVAALETDEDGRATVQVKVPDNLTRYRVMANVVWKNTLFGSAETTLTARLPLTIRPSAPRFANFGDAFEFPMVVHNTTNLEADVAYCSRRSVVQTQ